MKKYIIYSIIMIIVVIALLIIIFGYLKILDFFLIYIALQAPFLLINYLSRNQLKIVCDNCYHKNSNKLSNCSKCGNNIENIVCPTCEGINAYNQKYCTECQTKLACGECII